LRDTEGLSEEQLGGAVVNDGTRLPAGFGKGISNGP
jgi:hypothetical protein